MIVVVGESCSGKDTLVKNLKKRGYKYGISYVTRPKRDNEVDGVDYHFISKDEFLKMDEFGLFMESNEFQGHYYGMTHDEFKESDIIITTPDRIKFYRESFEKLLVIYVTCNKATRINRMKSSRKWTNKEILDRIQYDSRLFKEVDYDIKYDTTYEIIDNK